MHCTGCNSKTGADNACPRRKARKSKQLGPLEVGPAKASSPSDDKEGPLVARRTRKEVVPSSGDSNLEKLLQGLDAFLRTVVSGGVQGNFHLEPKTIAHWTSLLEDVDGKWMKLLKYKRDAFLAHHYSTEPVPCPFSDKVKDCAGRLFNGPLHTALDSICRRRSRNGKTEAQWLTYQHRRHSMLLTLCSVKLICPRPDKKDLDDNIRATVDALTTEVQEPGDLVLHSFRVEDEEVPRIESEEMRWCDAEDFVVRKTDKFVSVDLVRRTIRSILREVIDRRKWRGGRSMCDTFFPPTRANYDYSIANGGGVMGLCEDDFLDLNGYKQPGGLLPSMTEHEIVGDDGNIYQVLCYDERDEMNLGSAWADILSKIRSTDSIQKLKPIALAEPLKVRVITKGSWKVFMALRNLQQFLAKQLKQHSSFVLTGTPVTSEIVSRLGTLREGESFLNGDYTAATNNIRSWISRLYVEELGKHLGLSDQLFCLLLDGMVNNLVEGPDGSLKQQQSGQPMGFNNSFVGLCICNAALAKIVRAFDEGDIENAPRLRLEDCRILVNGDDLLMPLSLAGYRVWKCIGAWVGLSPSIGKTYFTTEFAQINSRNFLYVEGEYQTIYGVNLGLLEGAAKKGRHVDEMNLPCALSQLSNNYRQLMADAPSLEEKKRIHGLFTRRHRKRLEEARVPWYVPCWAGGLGLTGLFLPSEMERRAMHYIRLNYKSLKPKSIPVGEDASGLEPDKEWFVHQLASADLPEPMRTFDAAHPGILEYNKAIGKKSLDMLFDSSRNVAELFHATSVQDQAMRNFRHNQRMWKKVMSLPALPEPLLLKESIERTVYECYPVLLKFDDCDGRSIPELETPYVSPLVTFDAECPDGYLVRNDEDAWCARSADLTHR